MKNLFLISFSVLALYLSSCEQKKSTASTQESPKPEPGLVAKIDTTPKTITWEEMKVLIAKADYQTAGQSHDLMATLVYDNGTRLQAKQPKIDAIFEEMKKCEKCKDIIRMTE
ncbi:MAG: hypothetical protein J0M25_14105 [Flavobacteriales bacterium]|nr:hypothetical protein [Flavobacteriales bacterium]